MARNRKGLKLRKTPMIKRWTFLYSTPQVPIDICICLSNFARYTPRNLTEITPKAYRWKEKCLGITITCVLAVLLIGISSTFSMQVKMTISQWRSDYRSAAILCHGQILGAKRRRLYCLDPGASTLSTDPVTPYTGSLRTSRVHELHDSKLPFASRI